MEVKWGCGIVSRCSHKNVGEDMCIFPLLLALYAVRKPFKTCFPILCYNMPFDVHLINTYKVLMWQTCQ